jgi:hypothetical protein
MLSAYCGVKYRVGGKNYWFVWAIIWALIMGVFHNGLIIYTVIMVSIIAFWPIQSEAGITKWAIQLQPRTFIYIGLVVAALVTLALTVDSNSGSRALHKLLDGRLLEYAVRYREKLPLGRAHYGIPLDVASLGGFLLSSALIFIHYLFAPFPWQISNFTDVYGSLESLLRLLLIIFSIKAWYEAKGTVKGVYALLLALYFTMSVLWAYGTANYGTASRHNAVHYWIIVLLGMPALLDFIKIRLERIIPLKTQASTRGHIENCATQNKL